MASEIPSDKYLQEKALYANTDTMLQKKGKRLMIL